MTETTLYECRRRLQALATEDGTYSIRCARTGKRPHPVAGKRFDCRETAVTALAAAETYRRLLRTYDPELCWHDLIVCEELSPEKMRHLRNRQEGNESSLGSLTDQEHADRSSPGTCDGNRDRR
jgi:hypothetical protein